MGRPLIKLNAVEANGIFETFKPIMFNHAKKVVEKFSPSQVKELVQHDAEDYRIISFGNFSIEKKVLVVKGLRCDREISGWEVVTIEDGERCVVSEGNSWGVISANFVNLVLKSHGAQSGSDREVTA